MTAKSGIKMTACARTVRWSNWQNSPRILSLTAGNSRKQFAGYRWYIRHVHVIGAGEMGSNIAAWCAMQGTLVTWSDPEVEPLGKTVRKTVALCQDQHKSSIETRKTLDRLIPDVKNTGMAKADLIIEAAPKRVSFADQAIGLHAARLLRDGGTLQIGK